MWELFPLPLNAYRAFIATLHYDFLISCLGWISKKELFGHDNKGWVAEEIYHLLSDDKARRMDTVHSVHSPVGNHSCERKYGRVAK